jgi:hypothetical protein
VLGALTVLDDQSEKSGEGKQAASDVLDGAQAASDVLDLAIDRAIAVSRQLAAADASVARAIDSIVTDDDAEQKPSPSP